MIELAVIVLRWLQYAGAVVLFGAALFQLYNPPMAAAPKLRLMVLGAALALVLAAPVGLFAQTVVMAGSVELALDPVALDFIVRQTALGLAHVGRTILAVAALALILSRLRGRSLWATVAILGLAICASFAWSGHAGATTGALGPLHLVADSLHTAAAGAWLGALAAFVTVAGRRSDTIELHHALAGFANIGTGAVVILTATGLVNAFILVGPDNLLSALGGTYGQLLALKIGLFALMIGLAASNRFVLTPALGQAAGALGQDAPRGRLRRSLVLETALGVALLAVVAVMGTLAPPAAL